MCSYTNFEHLDHLYYVHNKDLVLNNQNIICTIDNSRN